MTFEAALVAHLKGDAAVVALVADRLYPMMRPHSTPTPAVTYQRVSGQRANSLAGFTSGLTQIRVQVDCWGATYEAAGELASAIAARMDTAAASFSSLLVFDQDVYEEDVRLFRRVLDFNVWFTE